MTLSRRQFSALGAALLTAPAWAQEWPARQALKLIVPYPPGGNADAAARTVAEVLTGTLRQTVLVDNRPGASSIIGTEVVAKSPPDGYTLGVVSDSHAINHAMARLPKAQEVLGARVPYDAVKDFVPVAGMLLVPLVLVAHPKVAARNVKDLVALSNKGQGVNFGTMGPGSPWHVHMHQLRQLTAGGFVDVPYKGLAPAANDLLGGQIETMVMPVHFAQQHVRSGKLIALATLGAQRHPLMPDVPTLAESGYPGLVLSNYLYFVAPAGTPPAIVERLSREITGALRLPQVREKLANAGDPYPVDGTELSARLRRDIDAYGAVIQQTMR